MEQEKIDIINLFNKIWSRKWFVVKGGVIGIIIGLIIAFSIPKSYKTKIEFITLSKTFQKDGMRELASLARINIGNEAVDILSPEVYYNVLMSTSFAKEILEINVKDEGQDIDTSLYNYYLDHQKSAWWNYVVMIPNYLRKAIKKKEEVTESVASNKYYISKEENEIIEKLQISFSLKNNDEIGITVFEYVAQSPIIAAFIADTIVSKLQEYIIKERTKKAKIDFLNTQKLYEQSKDNYSKLLNDYAQFVDENKNIISAKYEVNRKHKEDEMSLAYSVYNQMAQQLQLAQIKVQNDTPTFTIIQPSTIPIYPEVSKALVLLIVTFLAGMFSCFWVIKSDIWEFIS